MALDHRRLTEIIDFLPDATLVIDREGRIIAWNKAMEAMTGVKAETVLGKGGYEHALPFYGRRVPILVDLVLSPDKTAPERYIFFERENNTLIAEVYTPYLNPGGAYLWGKASPLHDPDGALVGAIEIVRDITERKATEKALRESESKLRFLSSQLLKAHEQERRRLSRELHDELGQTLNVLKLQISYIEKRLRKDQKDLKLDCEFLRQYMDEIIDSVRRISRDLSPSILEDLGLSVGLQHLIDEFTRHYRIQVRADLPDLDRLIPQEYRIHIYRIFQESLTNIAKHADASQLTITIQKQGGYVRFAIEDDGKGFNLEQVSELNEVQKGLGLAAMNERVHMLGGSMEIWSQEGTGTRIGFSLEVAGRETSDL